MYKDFLKSELKKWSRDSLMGFMLVYPLIFAFLGRYGLVWVEGRYGFDFSPYTDLILVIMVLLVPISFGALLGFSILEDRDDEIFQSIRISPLSIETFIGFRLVLVYFLCLLATIFIIWFSEIGGLKFRKIVEISILASLEAPLSGLMINALAKNKIEGFAIVKGGSSIIILPIIALFFSDIKELLFSFAPGFWTAKSISVLIRNGGLFLSYRQYFFIGIIYMTILNILTYKYLVNKTIT